MSDNKPIPKHVGIIMDGNRRWARERNLPTLEGHRRGFELMKQMPEWFFKRKVPAVSVFAFSTENWQRQQEEVNYLMKLLKKAVSEDMEEMKEAGYKLLFSGRIDELPGDLPELCREAAASTENNSRGILNVCLNYGGRDEIVEALKKAVANKIQPEQVHEGLVRKYLYHSELGDPDIIVRTSGEQRISGFLLWQAAYSEFMFMQKYWPDFEKDDVSRILEEYAGRERRFGKG